MRTAEGNSVTKRSLGSGSELADVDHATLVGADADRPLPLDHLDLEPQLASVEDLGQASPRGALAALERSRDVLDADLEAHGRLAVGEVLEREHRRGPLHHPDHPRSREDPGA